MGIKTQCDLRKGDQIMTAWIDKRGAKLGAKVEVKFDEGEKEVWTVTGVYSSATDAEVQEAQSAHRHHRKRTDI